MRRTRPANVIGAARGGIRGDAGGHHSCPDRTHHEAPGTQIRTRLATRGEDRE